MHSDVRRDHPYASAGASCRCVEEEAIPVEILDHFPATIPSILTVQQVMQANFPELWREVDLGLAVYGTLLLADTVNCPAVIFVTVASGGKTTVLEILDHNRKSYRSDDFTPAAFVTQAANRTAEDLAKIDLLPRIKHRVLLTPDLGATFRGKDDDLTDRFKVLTRVLDGRGYMRDSGSQGQRGYNGDYLFGWLGGTTPFKPIVWEVMSTLGNRLFFWPMRDADDETEDDLMALDCLAPYDVRRDACQAAVRTFLNQLIETLKVRGVKWVPEDDPEPLRRWITRCAMLVSHARSMRQDEETKRESARRARAVLLSIARGHAVVHERRQITADDVRLIVPLTVGSLPPRQARLFKALAVGKSLSRRVLADVIGRKDGRTVDTEVAPLVSSGITAWKKSVLEFTERFEWCNHPDLLGLL
jgi:hypothetical protein